MGQQLKTNRDVEDPKMQLKALNITQIIFTPLSVLPT